MPGAVFSPPLSNTCATLPLPNRIMMKTPKNSANGSRNITLTELHVRLDDLGVSIVLLGRNLGVEIVFRGVCTLKTCLERRGETPRSTLERGDLDLECHVLMVDIMAFENWRLCL
jgi:hypothetical protein